MEKTNAIWFSRHEPTMEQLNEAESMGFKICGVEQGMEAGSFSINEDSDVKKTLEALTSLKVIFNAFSVFGVFPTPILSEMEKTAEDAIEWGYHSHRDAPCFASHNVNRAKNGERPTFEHSSWKKVGWLTL